jgi:hypothetical protein
VFGCLEQRNAGTSKGACLCRAQVIALNLCRQFCFLNCQVVKMLTEAQRVESLQCRLRRVLDELALNRWNHRQKVLLCQCAEAL